MKERYKKMKKKKIVSLLMASTMLLGTACSTAEETTTEMTTLASKLETSTEATEAPLPYTFGLGETFHANEPTTYSMFFSDASWYAMQPEWETEGVFKKIEEKTNVKLKLTSYDSNDYMQKITLDLQAGNAAYIIPKVYDESAFVDGGAVVPVSQYVQYMPYFTDFYNKYNMKDDIDSIYKANGNFYRLPGMHEKTLINYSLIIRKDIFDAAGVDVPGTEKDWTWNDLCDDLIKVKAYMVKQGMCKEKDYIWSDPWCGNESGHGNGGNLLNVIGNTYDVNAGWGLANGVRYDQEKKEFVFSPTTENYKEMLKVVNRFIKEGILDPETFTQDDSTATDKFFNGQTAIISVNQSQYGTYITKMNEVLGEGKYDTYLVTPPKGSTNLSSAGATRLENGVMLSQKALDELGEDGFIELVRFVDWLFYSPEAYTLTKWGVEGETYKVNADGKKELLPGFKCGGLGLVGSDEDTDIRLKWGYAGGNFFYAHSTAESTDHFTDVMTSFVNRNLEYREQPKLGPAVITSPDENEEMNLIATPLTDNVNTWTLKFVTGKEDIDKKWDEYVKSCEDYKCADLVAKTNEIAARFKK